MTTLTQAAVAIPLMAFVIFATRAFPFVLFSRRDPPKLLRFVERFIPPMVMAVLVVYCLKDIDWGTGCAGVRELVSLAVVCALHLTKKNAMLSIFGGTAVYMVLIAL